MIGKAKKGRLGLDLNDSEILMAKQCKALINSRCPLMQHITESLSIRPTNDRLLRELGYVGCW